MSDIVAIDDRDGEKHPEDVNKDLRLFGLLNDLISHASYIKDNDTEGNLGYKEGLEYAAKRLREELGEFPKYIETTKEERNQIRIRNKIKYETGEIYNKLKKDEDVNKQVEEFKFWLNNYM